MAARELGTRIQARLRKHGASVKPRQLAQLTAYFGLLTKWNSTINLAGFDLEDKADLAIDRLLVEPMLAAASVQLPSGSSLMDLGSGGGSPAIPLKIAFPEIELIMVESKARKAAFLREVIRELELTSAKVSVARFERLLLETSFHEAADTLSIRAVKAERRVWDIVSTFLKPGGTVMWFRSVPRIDAQDYIPAFEITRTISLRIADNSELAILTKRQ